MALALGPASAARRRSAEPTHNWLWPRPRRRRSAADVKPRRAEALTLVTTVATPPTIGRAALTPPPPATSLDPRLAAAVAAVVSAAEPILKAWLVAVLADARREISPLQGAGEREDGQIVYSVAEVAKRVGLCRSTIYSEIASGRLIAHRRGARAIIYRADLDAYLAALPKLEPARPVVAAAKGAQADAAPSPVVQTAAAPSRQIPTTTAARPFGRGRRR
jgi:excisionase family DNA binding protein